MDLPTILLLFITGLAGGVMAAMVGGASVITFPVMLATGLNPVVATASNLIAVSRARARARGRGEPRMSVTSLPMLVPISVYGGYFGAGVGVLLLGVLSIATGGDYRSANVAKNLVTGLNTFAASLIFIGLGAVAWPQTLVMMAGCIIGGHFGARFARAVPQSAMRVVVVAVGLLLTIVFAWKYWF